MRVVKRLRQNKPYITCYLFCVLPFLQLASSWTDKIHVERDGQNEIVGFTYWGGANEIENAFLEACRNCTLTNGISARLEGHELEPKEIQFLKKLKRIRELHLGDSPSGVRVSTSLVAAIGELSDLQAVTICSDVSRGTEYVELGNLKKLQRLEFLGNSKLSAEDLDAISDLSNLQILGLRISDECKSFDWLGNLKLLSELRIYGRNRSGGNLAESLKKNLSLTSLELFGFTFSASDLTVLAKSHGGRITSLEIEIDEPEGVLSALLSFPNLKRLCITLPENSKPDFSTMSRLQRIENLCVRGLSVESTRDLDWVKKHRSLQSVLFTNRFGNEVLAHVKGQTKVPDQANEGVKDR